MKKEALLVIILTAIIASCINVNAQDTITSDKHVYFTSRLVTPRPLIDGKLDDDCWKHGTWAGDWHQFTPHEGGIPTYPTEFNLQYDDRYLYVAFRAYDKEPGKIKRLAAVRDQFSGDCLGICFDSYRDFRTSFEFDVTAWGQKLDVIVSNPTNLDFNWNAVYKVKVGIEDSAWVAEYEIPLNQLRYSGRKDQVWGLQTWRWISRLSEESNWSPQKKNTPGYLYTYGELRGISNLKKNRRLELMPFTSGEIRTMPEEPGNPFTKNGRLPSGNAGLDVKIGVSSNFTLDLTVNPDFGQVESDPSVMNLTAFETFYEEKRPFFLEGVAIFDYGFDNQNLFYSRRIGHKPSLQADGGDSLFVKNPDKTSILSAVKFSGTTSRGLSVGLIHSVTANQRAVLSDMEGNRSHALVEPLTSYTIGRIRKGYNSGNTFIGGIITSTNRIIDDPSLDFLARNAYTGGIDVLHHWKDQEFFVDASLSGSFIEGSSRAIRRLQENPAHYFQKPDADYLSYDTLRSSLSGQGGKISIGKSSKGNWRYSTGLSWMSPGYDINDVGYMQTADEVENDNEVTYQYTKPVSVFHFYSVNVEQSNSWNYDGKYLGSGGRVSFSTELKNNWTVRTGLRISSNMVSTRLLRGGPDMLVPWRLVASGQFRTDGSKNVVAGLEYSYSHTGDHSGQSYSVEPRISVRPFRALKMTLSGDYSQNSNDLQYVCSVSGSDEQRNYILALLHQNTLGLTFRTDLNLTPEFSIQYYGSPFFSKGMYSGFKYVTDSEARNYESRFAYHEMEVKQDNMIDLWKDGAIEPSYSVGNPDFNFSQFRSNLVAKWEYRQGSFLYLVWSGDITGSDNSGNSGFKDSFRMLGRSTANNIFLVKLNYWFSL